MRQYGEKFYAGVFEQAFSRLTLPDFVEGSDANNLYNNAPITGFTFAAVQNETEFTQYMKERNIVPMAIGTDFDSPVVPFAKEGIRYAGGTIPRFKTRKEFNEQDIRKGAEVASYDGADAFRMWAEDNIFYTNEEHITSHWNRQTWLRHQLVSKGQVILDKTNNPYGVTGIVIPGNVPSENITRLAGENRWWTDSIGGNQGSSSSIPESLNEIADNVSRRYGLRSMHWEVDYDTAKAIVNHDSVISALAVIALTNAAVATTAESAIRLMKWDARLEALNAILTFPIRVIDHLAANEKFDKSAGRLTKQELNSFDPNVIVLMPDGELGRIVPLRPIQVGRVEHFANFFDGRGKIVTKWDEYKSVEYMEFELTATPVLDMPQYMYYLDFMGDAGISGVSASINLDPAVLESTASAKTVKATKASKTEE